jgi:mannose-1-phosphate guanylyltransferase/mannose-6-phosphate isomerase
MSTLIPCIIAGGAGTRLWPVSREAMPKPFMRLPDGESLLQKTFVRAVGLADVDRILTVTNRDVYFRTVDDYRQLNKGHVSLDFILEPLGRNTAPAIAAAALHVARLYGDDAHLLILPADHLIKDVEAFAQAVNAARVLADQG